MTRWLGLVGVNDDRAASCGVQVRRPLIAVTLSRTGSTSMRRDGSAPEISTWMGARPGRSGRGTWCRVPRCPWGQVQRDRPPYFARTLTESKHTRPVDHADVAELVEHGPLRNFSHAPDTDHSRSRQHVIPDPYPSSGGTFFYGIPVPSTNTIPANTFRSGTRGCPVQPLVAGRREGINGTNRSQNTSVMNRAAPGEQTGHEPSCECVRP